MRNSFSVLTVALIFAVFFSNVAQGADACSTTPNLAAGLGPVFDQADTSWCHSYTAADLLTQKLQRMKILKMGERIHPLAVAAILQMTNQVAPDFGTRFGGTALENFSAVEYASTKFNFKLCKQNEFGDLDLMRNPVSKQAKAETMQVLRRAMEVPLVRKFTPRTCGDSGEYSEFESIVQAVDSDRWKNELRRRCSVKMPKLEFVSHTRAEWSADIDDADHIVPNPVREKAIGDAIDEALNGGAIAGIDYRPNFMLADDYKIKSTHWSSIIARRRAPNGECQYLIRNSWGKDCEPVADRASCLAGKIWVSREKLLRSTDAVQYIK